MLPDPWMIIIVLLETSTSFKKEGNESPVSRSNMLTHLAGAKEKHDILMALPPSQHKILLTLTTNGIH